jgi:hypothetical protein
VAARSTARLLGVMGLWLLYLLAIPVLWIRYGNGVMLLMPTVGAFLYTWMAFYAHELLHNYFPGVHNPTWYNLVSYSILADPQVYRVAHAYHHAQTHTAVDAELYLPSWGTSLRTRRSQFVLEFFFGIIVWELNLRRAYLAARRIQWAGVIQSTCYHLGFLFVLAYVTESLEYFGWPAFLANYFLTMWFGSVIIRHNQWLEHLGVFCEGTLAHRREHTRNLSTQTLMGKVFAVMTHNESAVHLFHHTEPGQDTRHLAVDALPKDCRLVTPIQYLRILKDYARTLWTDDQDVFRPERMPAYFGGNLSNV